MAKYFVVTLVTIIIMSIVLILYDSFSMDMYQCEDVSLHSNRVNATGANTRVFADRQSGFDITADRPSGFDINTSDVMVLLHIQKTGGSSFGRHLVRDLDVSQHCACQRGVKTCHCPRPGKDNQNWLFSEFTLGWSCGLHADWTELTNCVPQMLNSMESSTKPRRYFYMTVLRDPVTRYLSEWKHVQRGATWKTALHMCDGRPPTKDELPPCYQGLSWLNVSLGEFLDCPHNLASNRQTRMLADLAEVGCYDRSKMADAERQRKMLESAKRNLRRLAFVGLLEYQEETQRLFESTFKLSFRKDFVQFDVTRGNAVKDALTDAQLQQIRKVNALDLDLYEFAKELFLERVATMDLKRDRRASFPKPRKWKRRKSEKHRRSERQRKAERHHKSERHRKSKRHY